MMEVIVKLIERNNLVSYGKCSDEHAVASRITSEAVVSEFRGTTKLSILTADATTDKFVSEHAVADGVAGESVVSEGTATNLYTPNSGAATDFRHFEVILSSGKLVNEHGVSEFRASTNLSILAADASADKVVSKLSVSEFRASTNLSI